MIRQAHGTQAQTVSLIDQAQQALAAGKLDGNDGAGALYQRVLRDDPGNAVAAHGLDQVCYALAVQARQAFDAKDMATANARIEQLAALQPNNGALPALRALQAQTRKQDSDALDATLQQAQDALRAGHISGAGDDSALARYQAALAIEPDNRQAKAGLGKVAQALTVRANAALDAGDTVQAAALLDQAAPLAPKSADLAAARARLDSLRPASTSPSTNAPSPVTAADAPVAPAVVVLSPQQSAAVAQLVQRARLATRNGSIMMPPGDCAYDLYRSALAIDGNNVAARQGLQGLPGEVEKQVNQSLAAGKLDAAGNMLANLAELSPGDVGQVTVGNRLASAWLDKAVPVSRSNTPASWLRISRVRST
jgi:tetratricopeptide (TPR) repeat protein